MPQHINYDTSQFKTILNEYRVNNGWTHDRAASYWKIARPLYTQYENGKTRIPLEFCLLVCQDLGLDLRDFVSRV